MFDILGEVIGQLVSDAVERFVKRLIRFSDTLYSLVHRRRNVTALDDLEFGAWAEDQAGRYVKKKGMKVLARNYRVGPGELDIVARDHEWIVFIEVKAARDPEGEPELKVNREKRRRMITAAKSFIGRMRLQDAPARFDILTVKCDEAGQAVIEHEEDAFQA